MKKYILAFFVSLIAILLGLIALPDVLFTPSNNKDWTEDQKLMAQIELVDENKILIKDVRNIMYKSTTDYNVFYYDKEYDLNNLQRVWLLLEPFDSFGAAHTLLSFEFENMNGKKDYIAISVEIRKENGEKFSPFKGVLGRYEIAYVIADEADVIKLRTNYRKDTVLLYPIKANNAKLKEVFMDMLNRASSLQAHPEFYNTITNNCTTNIARHARHFSEKPIPWYNLKYLMPKHIDELVYKLGMIDTDLTLEQARAKFNITNKAQECDEDVNFSECIREGFYIK